MMKTLIVSLDSQVDSLEIVGGKGRSLAKLTNAGFAVSPGKVSGVASVIMSRNDFDKMQPDSILVCPLTTPAWIQLFPHATALVTDVGSILAHGSVVAREYGIPAVLGVGDATQQIKSGGMLEVDGDRGTVKVLPLEWPK